MPIEIVSADSGQMIRSLDIGTAKPGKKEQKQVQFHLIDIIEPGDDYSAFQFIADADRAITEILSRKKVPVIAGGTGLYLKALVEGVFDIESHDPQIRIRLEKELEELGAEAMYNILKNVDPDEAAKVHLNNKVRVIRALEIYYLTGLPKSELTKSGRHKKSRFDFQFFSLMPPRAELYERINSRVDEMIKNGLLDEIKGFIKAGNAELVQKMNVIGYNELFEHISGNITLEQAVLLIKQNSRRYAKRQFTWFRRQIKSEVFTNIGDIKKAFFKSYAGFAFEPVIKLDLN